MPGQDPEVPDVKKAVEQRQQPFVWSPGGSVSKAAASSINRAPPEPPGWRERLRSPWGVAVVLGTALAGGGSLFALTALSVSEAGGGVPGGDMPAGASRRAFRAENRMLLRGGRDDARQDRMKLGGIAAGEQAGPGGVPHVIPEEPEDEGGGPMAYDRSGGQRAVGAGAPAPGKDAQLDGGAGGSASGPQAPRLSTRLDMRGMRAVSANAGFRGLRSGRAIARTIRSKGPAPGRASGSAAEYGDGFRSSAAGASGGIGASGSGVRGAADAEGEEDAQARGAASGGAGGGAGDGAAPAPEWESPKERMERLLREAAADDARAQKEKRRADALRAGGHLSQAHYHYDRYEKKRDSSREKAAEAQKIMGELHAEAAQIAEDAGTATGGASQGAGQGEAPQGTQVEP